MPRLYSGCGYEGLGYQGLDGYGVARNWVGGYSWTSPQVYLHEVGAETVPQEIICQGLPFAYAAGVGAGSVAAVGWLKWHFEPVWAAPWPFWAAAARGVPDWHRVQQSGTP